MNDVSKAGLLKRFSAFLLDLILTCILATGFFLLIGTIADYYGAAEKMSASKQVVFDQLWLTADETVTVLPESVQELYQKHQAATEAVTSAKDAFAEVCDVAAENVTMEIYNTLTREQQQLYEAYQEAVKEQAPTKTAFENGFWYELDQKLYDKLPESLQKAYSAYDKDMQYCFSIVLVTISLGLFFAILVIEFVLPLIFKNGQTLGKKIFGIGVMQIDGTKLRPVACFVRAMLGKYAIETMFPVMLITFIFFIGGGPLLVILLFALIIFQIILFLATKEHRPIHDAIASSVTVDLATQMIFDSIDDKIAYIEQQHLEQVNSEKIGK